MKFRLNPFIEATYKLNAVADNGGKLKRVTYPIKPNATYDTADFIEATPNIEVLVKNTVSFIPYKDATVKQLKELDAPYTLKGCKACGGRITQIKLYVFEVLE